MSFIGGTWGSYAGGATRYGATRGRIMGGYVQGINYPSPFFDLAHTYLPATVKQLFKLCRYYFLTVPITYAAIMKLSEYPVTDLVLSHDDPDVTQMWQEFLQDHLRYRAFQIGCNLDYHVTGNALVSISYPFRKVLECTSCRFSGEARKLRPHWSFVSHEFRLTCPKCGTTAPAKVHEQFLRDASGVRLLRWNVEDIEVRYNELSGETTYFYNIPPQIRNDITIGTKEVVEKTPQAFIQAIKQSRGLVLSADNVFHLKRPSLAYQDRGWGIPCMLPLLKDAFQLRVMQKANESLLVEHVTPLRVLFPQAASGSADPFVSTNLVQWREQVAGEIARWRMDSNYIPLLPLPIGYQAIGGDARQLLLSQEIRQAEDSLINGLQCPIEFVRGGTSWSGTNVSLRMVENQFLGNIIEHRRMLAWVIKNVASFLRWPVLHSGFKPFKMSDDIQRKAYRLQLKQLGMLSDTTLLADDDFDQQAENATIVRETAARLEATKKQQLAMAEVQAEVQAVMMKSQAKVQADIVKAQQAPVAPGEPGRSSESTDTGGIPTQASSPLQAGQPAGVDLLSMGRMLAQQYGSLPPDQQQQAIQNLSLQSPELAELVQQELSRATPAQLGAPGIDMRPLPEARAPRRATPTV